jgi:polyferredoxin
VKQQVLGPWLRSGLSIVAFYALIQLLIAGVELHRVPAYTSIFLWSLLALAAFTGLFLKDRAFCRGFCPVGLLLSTYGRGAILAVRPGGEGPCGDCAEKDCRRPENRTRLDARSCPSLVLLAAMACFAVRESRLADPASHPSRLLSLALAVLASAALIFGWRFSG